MLNIFFFFNDTATTEIYTLSLHDALPISARRPRRRAPRARPRRADPRGRGTARPTAPAPPDHPNPQGPYLPCRRRLDRKSTRLNSSHANISYAVFCLKKKKENKKQTNSDI